MYVFAFVWWVISTVVTSLVGVNYGGGWAIATFAAFMVLGFMGMLTAVDLDLD